MGFFYIFKTENKNISDDRKVIENKRFDVMSLERDIIIALRQVYDPEIPVNV